MISTNNPELDAAFAELQGQVIAFSEQNALKAGNIAGLHVELKAANEKVAELEKKLAVYNDPNQKAIADAAPA